jgi:hypothetical protein
MKATFLFLYCFLHCIEGCDHDQFSIYIALSDDNVFMRTTLMPVVMGRSMVHYDAG